MTPYFEPQFWDRLIALPLALIIIFTFIAMLQIISTDGVFRRWWRRALAAAALAGYGAVMVYIGNTATSGRWNADVWTFLRFSAQAIPTILMFIAACKLQDRHERNP